MGTATRDALIGKARVESLDVKYSKVLALQAWVNVRQR